MMPDESLPANPALAEALRCAARGWAVLPLEPGEKVPLGALVPHGLLDATTDPGRIEHWWTLAPDAGVGIRTGAVSGLVVLDIDPRHGGDESIEELERRHGKLPDTVVVLTGGGGRHVFFSHPGPGLKVPNAIRLGTLPGIDVRADGGYVVAPPSRHPSGRTYAWELSSHPDDIPLATLPDWLSQLMRPAAPPVNGTVSKETIPEGERNTILTSLAGSMRKRGMGPAAILAALLAENAQRCLPPLLQVEVERIAASVSRYAPAPPTSVGKISQATRLVELASDAQLFHTQDNEPFAAIQLDGHRETWSLKSRSFSLWLRRCFFEKSATAPSAQAIQDAVAILESKALFEGPTRPVFTRLAEHKGDIYLDLANGSWEVVRITSAGWEVMTEPPVHFRRAKGMASLPHPAAGGHLDQLRVFVNVAREGDWILLLAWMLGALRANGPYPILALHGEHGSAKSTTARIVRSLIDPSTTPLRTEPRDGRDVMIGARNAWCLVFDNLSALPLWFSDMLCRLSTGGGLATRELYSDAEEVLFEAQRPVILTGIEEIASQGDLLDRILILELPGIDDDHRCTEANFWKAFEQGRPLILGALLDGVSGALRVLPTITLSGLPRMADFAVWASAGLTALGGEPSTFLTAYAANRDRSHEVALEASLLAAVVETLVAVNGGSWEGTATELLKTLTDQADESVRRQRGWPASARAASNALRRLQNDLRAVGVCIEFRKEPGGRRRLIAIRKTAPSTVPTVPTVPDDPSVDSARPQIDAGRDAGDDRDAGMRPDSGGAVGGGGS